MKTFAQIILCVILSHWIQYLAVELYISNWPWYYWFGFQMILSMANSVPDTSRRYFGGWTIFFCLCAQVCVLIKWSALWLIFFGYFGPNPFFIK